MRTILLLACLLIPAQVQGSMIYDLVPSSETRNISGLQFSTTGDDFVLTNTLTTRDSSVYFLDFGVSFDHVDVSGNVVYAPANATYQLYVLDSLLGTPSVSVITSGIFVGTPTAYNRGDGRYEFKGDLVGFLGQPTANFNANLHVDVAFDTRLPLGHQIERGDLTVLVIPSVPEPTSVVLLGIGLVTIVGYTRSRR